MRVAARRESIPTRGATGRDDTGALELPAGPGLSRLRRSLLDWYATNARDLPWRATRDPYAIWISEAMLQQTQVATVIPYHARFLELFPNVRALSEATDETLLGAWSGLGYYSRARKLREAAAAILERHGGEFPRTRAAALALPGVGPYTAGAVLSIAYGLREPLVDGNVARVFARLFLLEDPIGSSALQKRLWRLAEHLLPAAGARPERGPGEFNQAIMELGATICRPKSPDCLLCPVSGDCAARKAGRTADLPVPKPRAKPTEVELETLLVQEGTRVLLHRRPDGGRMAGLLELPTIERTSDHLFPRAYPHPGLEPGEELGQVRHGITRYRITATVRAGRLSGEPDPDGPLGWFEGRELDTLPLTGMAKKMQRLFGG